MDPNDGGPHKLAHRPCQTARAAHNAPRRRLLDLTIKNLPLDVRDQIESRWGAPEADPFFANGSFALSIFFGNALVGVQPARGYNINPKETYHSPDLIPPHNYLAFYFWLRFSFKTNALVHMGKHGNLEWLPGKAIALSSECWPEVIIGPTPNAYPFIVNDPGEGSSQTSRCGDC